jgi:hypothetical protein
VIASERVEATTRQTYSIHSTYRPLYIQTGQYKMDADPLYHVKQLFYQGELQVAFRNEYELTCLASYKGSFVHHVFLFATHHDMHLTPL